jgi:hypothetical protein
MRQGFKRWACYLKGRKLFTATAELDNQETPESFTGKWKYTLQC